MQKINEKIFWTGYIDWDLRNFHGYSTPYGSTYNAYLIVDERPTLIDTVKHYGFPDMLSQIKQVISPEKIEFIVSNHTEMDHSGSIGKLLELCPKAQVVCSPKGHEGLKRHFKADWKFKVVNSGDTLNIGKYNLKFALTPMVHWPDSMVTYLPEEKILFSNDAFGQHYASCERFVDDVGHDIIFREAAKYYANIVMPYGGQVLKAFDSLKGLDIKTICPSHGLIWQKHEDIEKIFGLYNKWANHIADNKVVIIYDTMWHSTERIAKKIQELIVQENLPVKLLNLQSSHISDIMAEIMLAKVIIFGSAILNNQVLPSIGSLLTYLKGLRPKNKYAFTFGSYGWAKVGFVELENCLKDLGFTFLSEGKYFQFVPEDSELECISDIILPIKKLLKN